MLIYNVTIKVAWPIHDAWLPWMQQQHIPHVMNTACFTESRLVRLLDVDEEDGPTYAAQYHAASRADYDRYINEFAPTMRKHVVDNWGEQLVLFRSLMEVVH
jgi:hypothetical protein